LFFEWIVVWLLINHLKVCLEDDVILDLVGCKLESLRASVINGYKDCRAGYERKILVVKMGNLFI
jgi:hypothetical protein